MMLAMVADKIRKRGDWEIEYHGKEVARHQVRSALGRLCLDIAARVRDGGLTPEQTEAALDLAMPTSNAFLMTQERESEAEKYERLAKLFEIPA